MAMSNYNNNNNNMGNPSSSSFIHLTSSQQRQNCSARKIVAGYALHQRLGSGSFATVYKGVKASPDVDGADCVAIKAITRSSEKLTKKVLQNLELEISILRTYRHKNIVCMQDVQKTERHFYLILEYCGGGDVQKIIRGRKAGRLTERLTRRLMRDLASGLKFLWGQELIHRDIKPQNLLLTGALPLDELHDPERTQELEDKRRAINFPSKQFALKIADFGFARHLQSASLAETLCGSPLYMAPEILQHQRYDAKADLWSVGTVLFEMIAGRPPFNGENHIDLLRNMKLKAVRLPADVRVSNECVHLLRLLLNRNPVSRAGFKEFFEACDAFVALGCEGETTWEDAGTCRRPLPTSDLGTIHEVEDGAPGAESMITVQTVGVQQQQQIQQQQQQNQHQQHQTKQQQQQQQLSVSPSPVHTTTMQQNMPHTMTDRATTTLSGPYRPPITLQSANSPPVKAIMTKNGQSKVCVGLAPLQASPPSFGKVPYPSPNLPALPSLEKRQEVNIVAATRTGANTQHWQHQQQFPKNNADLTQSGRIRNDGSPLQNSSEESGFVMVEHGSIQRTDYHHQQQQQQPVVAAYRPHDGPARLEPSPPQSPRYYFNPNSSNNNPVAANTRGDYMVVNDAPRVPKGILSTSPGTGGALMGLIGGIARLSCQGTNSKADSSRLEAQIGSAANMLAAAEDVGRRAVSVAHLGDTRAYLALRFAFMSDDSSSLLSATPMEGVVEEDEPGNGNVTDDSGSTEVAGRRVSHSSDKAMLDAKAIVEEEDAEEMPFAISVDAPPSASTSVMGGVIPSRSGFSRCNSQKNTNMNSSYQVIKPASAMIRSHFSEALLCYVKALKMLKGSVVGVRQVEKDLASVLHHGINSEQGVHAQKLQKRCEVISNWLSAQFQGVLERADAANSEIGKISSKANETATSLPEVVPSVEELIYNHALSSGREGAVKQLLGQFEAARSCYRSAGLLAETLLMETTLGPEDRKILEGYVDGFAARITELDGLLVQQTAQPASRFVGGSSSSSSHVVGGSRRSNPGIVGLIGQQRPIRVSPTFNCAPSCVAR